MEKKNLLKILLGGLIGGTIGVIFLKFGWANVILSNESPLISTILMISFVFSILVNRFIDIPFQQLTGISIIKTISTNLNLIGDAGIILPFFFMFFGFLGVWISYTHTQYKSLFPLSQGKLKVALISITPIIIFIILIVPASIVLGEVSTPAHGLNPFPFLVGGIFLLLLVIYEILFVTWFHKSNPEMIKITRDELTKFSRILLALLILPLIHVYFAAILILVLFPLFILFVLVNSVINRNTRKSAKRVSKTT